MVMLNWRSKHCTRFLVQLTAMRSAYVLWKSKCLLSFGGAQYHSKALICEISSARHASLPLLVNIAEYHSLGRWIQYQVNIIPQWEFWHEKVPLPAARLEPWTLWVQEQCHTNSATATFHTMHVDAEVVHIEKCVPDQFLSDESCKLWLSPKDNSNTRGLTREYPKYPLTQSVGRENLSGESLVSCAPSRFSLEILPPSLSPSSLPLSFGEDLRILTLSPPSITLLMPTACSVLAMKLGIRAGWLIQDVVMHSWCLKINSQII